MKIIKSLLVISSFAFLMSCGTKSEVKEVCSCEKLSEDLDNKANRTYKYSYQGQLYTGSCETKDQHDSLIERKEYKNGILISSFIREQQGDKYITVHSMTYDDMKSVNGFTIKYTENAFVKFVTSVQEFKDGKAICDLEVNYTSSSNTIFYLNNKLDPVNGGLKEEGNGDFKTDFISFLEKVKKLDPRFEYFEK